MNIFLANKIEEGIAYFSEDESHHALKVLRLPIATKISFIDGLGGRYTGELLPASKSLMQAKIESCVVEEKSRAYHLHIAIAPTKNMERLEWFLEKSVELGIDEFSFICCERSERKVVKEERIKKVIEAAVKQSLQSRVPKFNSIENFSSFLGRIKELRANRFIAHCDTKSGFERVKFNALSGLNSECIFLIGPEGDFSPSEISIAMQEGFLGIDLGENRLRTETAGIYISAALACKN